MRSEESRSAIYEDDEVLAILDFRPVSEGHTLVIPKKHYENIFEIPEKEAAYLSRIVKKLAGAVGFGSIDLLGDTLTLSLPNSRPRQLNRVEPWI